MNRMSRFAVCVATVMMIAFVPARLVWSADDNASVAQVYLEFDPATGQFKSVPATADNSPDGSMVLHKSTAQSNTQAATPDNTAQQGPASTAPAGNNMVGAEQQGNSAPVIIGVVIALAVIGGIVAMTRKKTA